MTLPLYDISLVSETENLTICFILSTDNNLQGEESASVFAGE